MLLISAATIRSLSNFSENSISSRNLHDQVHQVRFSSGSRHGCNSGPTCCSRMLRLTASIAATTMPLQTSLSVKHLPANSAVWRYPEVCLDCLYLLPSDLPTGCLNCAWIPLESLSFLEIMVKIRFAFPILCIAGSKCFSSLTCLWFCFFCWEYSQIGFQNLLFLPIQSATFLLFGRSKKEI